MKKETTELISRLAEIDPKWKELGKRMKELFVAGEEEEYIPEIAEKVKLSKIIRNIKNIGLST